MHLSELRQNPAQQRRLHLPHLGARGHAKAKRDGGLHQSANFGGNAERQQRGGGANRLCKI